MDIDFNSAHLADAGSNSMEENISLQIYSKFTFHLGKHALLGCLEKYLNILVLAKIEFALVLIGS